MVDAEALQRRVAGGADVIGLAVDAEERPFLAAHVAELRGQHDLVAPAADGAADEQLVRERAVHVRRVDEVDAELERTVDRRDRLALVGRAVELRHPHAAQAFGRDLKRRVAAAQRTPVHVSLLRCAFSTPGYPGPTQTPLNGLIPPGGAGFRSMQWMATGSYYFGEARTETAR